MVLGFANGTAARIVFATYLAFFVVAFGWRSWLQYRRTGDTGFRLFSGSKNLVERATWSLGALGGVAVFLAPLLSLIGVIHPVTFPPAQVSGILAIVLGFVLTVIAQLQLGASWRIGVDPREVTRLVTHGVFRHVRNPIYAGLLMALLGVVLLLPHVLSALGFVLIAAAIELQVRRIEEPYLLQLHRESYRQYARSAGRFCPKLGYLP